MRISGITPADVTLLAIHMEKPRPTENSMGQDPKRF
jgi:hypothetical protein